MLKVNVTLKLLEWVVRGRLGDHQRREGGVAVPNPVPTLHFCFTPPWQATQPMFSLLRSTRCELTPTTAPRLCVGSHPGLLQHGLQQRPRAPTGNPRTFSDTTPPLTIHMLLLPCRSLFVAEIRDAGASALGEALKINTALTMLKCVVGRLDSAVKDVATFVALIPGTTAGLAPHVVSWRSVPLSPSTCPRPVLCTSARAQT